MHPSGDAADAPFHVAATDPFATPAALRDPVRRLRGRLPLPVTVWTAGPADAPAALTVSSVLVAQGEPSVVLGLVDADSDLWDALESSEVFVVHVLERQHAALADVFAGVRPAPGGQFSALAVTRSPYGPVLRDIGTRVGCRLVAARPAGWALLVEGRVEALTVVADPEPLVWHRGRYHGLA